MGSVRVERFNGIAIDSRRIATDQLFVAIKGEVHDGHRFAADVVRKGVKGLMLEHNRLDDLPWQDWIKEDVACIAVDDTIEALGRLAAYHRRRNGATVVAITGSNGKTTTRQMTAAVVSVRYRTLSTRKNFNNNIGLPLTLFELCPDHLWAVVELGMNAPGEIAFLAEICRPDIGVITNVAPAHLEGVGTIEGVMHAKGELLEKINSGGTAVINADDPLVRRLAKRAACEVMFFGLTESASVRAVDIGATERGSRFNLILPGGRTEIELKTPGIFMISNALAAAAVGFKIGLSPTDIREGLENFAPVQGRLNILATRSGIHIIDDTYNANPGSMAAALSTLGTLRKKARAFFVVGDMRELGRQAEELHVQLGALAARAEIAGLLVTGDFADSVVRGAQEAGMKAAKIVKGSQEALLSVLKEKLRPGDWVLVKGSRAMAMENVVQDLKAWAEK